MRLNTFSCIYLSFFISLWISIHVLCSFFGLFLLKHKFDVLILMPPPQVLLSMTLLMSAGLRWTPLSAWHGVGITTCLWNEMGSSVAAKGQWGSWSCWQRQGSPGRTRAFVSQIPVSVPFSLSEGPIPALPLIMTFSKVRVWFEALSLWGEWVALTQRLFWKVEDPENSDLFTWFDLFIELLWARHFQLFLDP